MEIWHFKDLGDTASVVTKVVALGESGWGGGPQFVIQ